MKRFLLQILIALALIAAPHALGPLQSPIVHAQVEVDLQWPAGTQFFKDDGTINDSGFITIQDAGTTSARTTYSEATGTTANTLDGSNRIVLDSTARTTESIYIPTGSWKFIIHESDGSTVTQQDDNLEGAIDTSSFTTTAAGPKIQWLSKTADYTITTTDTGAGKGIACNPTGGNIVLTLPNAATAGDGDTIVIDHNGTANQCAVRTVSSQTIEHFDTGTSRTTWVLEEKGETLWLASNGANWRVVSFTDGPRQHRFIVTDRTLSSPPSGPTQGAWYAINGTPSGDWSSASDQDLCQASGTGTWFCITPSAGWRMFVTSENVPYVFYSGQWNALPNTNAPTSSNLAHVFAVYQEVTGFDSVFSSSANTWNTISAITNAIVNTITNADLSSGVITLPPGRYIAWATLGVDAAFGKVQTRIRNADSSQFGYSGKADVGSGEEVVLNAFGAFDFTSLTDTVQLELFTESSAGTTGLGVTQNDGLIETYATLQVLDLSSLQGPIGPTGLQGATFAPGFSFNTSTDSGSDPGSGKFALSSGTVSAVTEIVFSSNEINGSDIEAWTLTWDDNGNSSLRGTLVLTNVADSTVFAIFSVTGTVDDQSGFEVVTVTHIASNGTFEGEVHAHFSARGDTGSGDVTGAASSTDNAIARFNGTGGKTIQNSVVTIADTSGDMDSGTGDLRTGGKVVIDVDGTAVDADGSVTLGAGQDASLYFDGTDAILETVGTADIVFNADGDTITLQASGGTLATFATNGLALASNDSVFIGGAAILADSAGTTTLSNIDALDATSESTIESAIDTLSNLTTTGALDSGSITSNFGSIDLGSSTFQTIAAVTAGTVDLTGGQLKFPVTALTTTDVNTLDDYEEGTWTPEITFVTPGDLSVVYSSQVGRYTKIGRMVFLEFNIQTSTFTHTTASGIFEVTGIPFTSGNTQRGGVTSFQGINKTGGYTAISGQVTSGTQRMRLFASGMNVGTAAIQASDMPTAGTVALLGIVAYSVSD